MIHNGFIIIETQWIHKGLGNNGFGSLQSRDDSNILQNLKFQNFPVPTMPCSFIPEHSSETVPTQAPSLKSLDGPFTDPRAHAPTDPRTGRPRTHGPTDPPRTPQSQERPREINDAATTTRRRHDQHDANTGPTPDPNYKREPFATHPGKSWNSF